MSFKRLLYNVIKIPLRILLLKTPLFFVLKKRFSNQNQIQNRSFVASFVDFFFFKEYFSKLKNPQIIRNLTDSTIAEGRGVIWTKEYYDTHFKTYENLKTQLCGKITLNEANPIYSEIINFINNLKLNNSSNLYLIQIGSCSGRDIEFFYNLFPNLNFISTDIDDEILNFQKEKYPYKNINFFKCYAEEIDKCFNHYNLQDKDVILFSVGLLQYIHNYFLNVFFKKINNLKKFNLFIQEPVATDFLFKNKKSENRWKSSFSHNYEFFAKDYKIIKKIILQPYEEKKKNVSHYFINISKGYN